MAGTQYRLVLPVFLIAALAFWTGSTGEVTVIATNIGQSGSNPSDACIQCLCYVSTMCDMSHGCTAGYCGPFNISRIYWVDAGQVRLPDAEPERNIRVAYEDCARSYPCAKRVVNGYLQKFGQDCNGDGVIDCYDYMMINVNGGYGCTTPLNRSVKGRRALERYEECRL